MVDAGLRDLGSQEPVTKAIVGVTSTDTTLVAAQAGKRIVVVYWSLGADRVCASALVLL